MDRSFASKWSLHPSLLTFIFLDPLGKDAIYTLINKPAPAQPDQYLAMPENLNYQDVHWIFTASDYYAIPEALRKWLVYIDPQPRYLASQPNQNVNHQTPSSRTNQTGNGNRPVCPTHGFAHREAQANLLNTLMNMCK